MQTNFSRLLVGSGNWTDAPGRLETYELRHDGGTLRRISRVEAGGLLSYAAKAPHAGLWYVADEREGAVFTFRVTASAELQLIARAGSAGHPVHVSVSPRGDAVLTAHHNEHQVEVLTVREDGKIGAIAEVQRAGENAHSAVFDPSFRYVYVPAKGSDFVACFSYDARARTLSLRARAKVPGGPRFITFHPQLPVAYVAGELGNTVTVCSFDAANGDLQARQTLSTLPAGPRRESTVADVRVTPSGKYVYVSNRTLHASSIAAFEVGPTGNLRPLGHELVRGQTPRCFSIHPNANLLAVGNQDSDTITVFRLDPSTGKLHWLSTSDVGVQPFFVEWLS